jgi:predicted alpha/beta superfamily hydrolase
MKNVSRPLSALLLIAFAAYANASGSSPASPAAAKDAVAPAPTPASLTALRIPAAAAAAPSFIQGGPAELFFSQQFILHSKNVGADYLIQVIEPIPFAPVKGADVLYLLDGGSFVGLVVSISQGFQMARETRPIYVVAVNFLGTTFSDLVAERWRDFAHDPVQVDKETLGGGGGKFEAFLTEELQPFIEARYPVDHAKSALAGDSLSGLFALHVLAGNSHAFSAYLIGSPSLWAGDKQLIARARQAAAQGNGCRVFIGEGNSGQEALGGPDLDRLLAALTSAGSTFVVSRKTYDGQTHTSVPPFTMSDGIRFLFPFAPSAK